MLFEYDPNLTSLAKAMRNQATNAEKKLWESLRGKQFHGLKFYRQKPIASYIADFYCSKMKLVIEIDGDIHDRQKAFDQYRTNELNKMGIAIVRYTNHQIDHELPRVLNHLKRVTDILLSKLPSP